MTTRAIPKHSSRPTWRLGWKSSRIGSSTPSWARSIEPVSRPCSVRGGSGSRPEQRSSHRRSWPCLRWEACSSWWLGPSPTPSPTEPEPASLAWRRASELDPQRVPSALPTPPPVTAPEGSGSPRGRWARPASATRRCGSSTAGCSLWGDGSTTTDRPPPSCTTRPAGPGPPPGRWSTPATASPRAARRQGTRRGYRLPR